MQLDPRQALEVTRYHTWPRLRDQSTGEHSAQVMRILLAIWPDAPRHLLVHCLVHDMGELVSGDPPYPVKKDNPTLKAECDRIENEAHLSMCLPWGLPPPQDLSEPERLIFKLAEFIEMWEWGLGQMTAIPKCELVVARCTAAIADITEQLEGMDWGVTAAKAIWYTERRVKYNGVK